MNDLTLTHGLLIGFLLVFAVSMVVRVFARDRGGWRDSNRGIQGSCFASSSREYRITDPPTRSIP